MRENFCQRFGKLRSLISAVGEQRLQEGVTTQVGWMD
jgi:hypothetical protein